MSRPMFRSAMAASAIGLLILPVASLQAQTSDDRMIGCRPVASQEDRDKIEMLRSSVLTSVAVSANNQICKVHDRLVGLFDRDKPEQIEMEEVVETAKPEVDPVLAQMERKRELNALEEKIKMREEGERIRKNRVNEYDEGMRRLYEKEEAARLAGTTLQEQENYEGMPTVVEKPLFHVAQGEGEPPAIWRANGTYDMYADAAPIDAKDVEGEGMMVSAEGIAVGTFDDGELEGEGEEIEADGTWRVGTFNDGKMNGPGIEFREEGDQTVMVGGNFVNDEPDGVVEYTYENGKSRRDLWANGERVATGEMAAAGVTPKNPVFKSREQLAAEEEAIFVKNIETVNNPGTLFTLADELAELGNQDRARRAFRALVRRFPDSPLAAQAAARLGSGADASTPATRQATSTSSTARWSSVCMRNMNKLQQKISAEGKTFQFSRGFYDALLNMVAPCQSYDSEARSEVGIKTRERASLSGQDPYDPNLAWLQAESRKAVSDPNYSADLGPVRLAGSGATSGGSGGAGGAGAAAPSRPATATPDQNAAYRTQIVDRILPASFHARFTGKGLPLSTCTAQEQANINYVEDVPANGTLALNRKLMAALELGLAIYKQCENDPAAWRQIEAWQQSRAQAFKNCKMVATEERACLLPYR